MTTLYELQKQYAELDSKSKTLRSEMRSIADLYKKKLSYLILEKNLLYNVKWNVGNCGLKTIRLIYSGDWPIEFSSFEFVSGHTIALLEGVLFAPYLTPIITFEDIDKAKWFINKYGLDVNGFDELLEIISIEQRLAELRSKLGK